MTPRPSPDESLLQGLRTGRRDAFERLYDEQHPSIYNLCARILGDREEAKDVTQETFIAAFSNPPTADSSLKLRAWLYRVATNACFDHLRSRKKIGGDDGMVEELASPIDEFTRAETVAAVEQTLGELNERYRTVLVLKDLHGLPPEEIAEVMEVSRPTADVLVHRARASFKAAFAKLGGDVPTPANLGIALAPLAVPATLHVMPPLPHAALPAHPSPTHPIPPHLAHFASQPHAGGLLNKVASAASTKIAIGAAAAILAVGGGVVAVRDVERGQGQRTADAASRPAAASHTTLSGASSEARHEAHARAHDTHLAEHSHDATHDGTHTSADDTAEHASESPQHDSASRDSTEHTETTTGPHGAGTISTSGSTGDGDHSTETTGAHDGTASQDHGSGE